MIAWLNVMKKPRLAGLLLVRCHGVTRYESLLDILDLLAHLFDQHLQLDRGLGSFGGN